MTVYDDNLKAESLKLLIDRIGRVNDVDTAVDLKIVVVNDNGEVVEFLMGSEHSSLPNLTFLNFTVAQNGINLIIIAEMLGRKSHSGCGRDALSERARRHIDAGNLLHIGVTLKNGADVTKG